MDDIYVQTGDRPPNSPYGRSCDSNVHLYRRKVKNLHEALGADDTRQEAADILRGLIEAIFVRPRDKGVEIELVGDIVKMLKLPEKGSSSLDLYESSVKVVAGAGFDLCRTTAKWRPMRLSS